MTRKLATLVFVGGAAMAYAQPAAHSPKFEVASIKRCAAGNAPGGMSATTGRLTVNCMTVRGLIDFSYVLYSDGTLHLPGRTIVPVERGPAWITSESYSIEAKTEGTPDPGTMRGPMLRALLEARFKLKIHTENREVPSYALTAGKDGPKLQTAQPGSCRPMDLDHPPPSPAPGQVLLAACKLGRITNDTFEVRGVTMAEFSAELSRRLDRDVIERTGIAGTFDIRVALSSGLARLLQFGGIAPPPPPGSPAGPPAGTNPAEPTDSWGAMQAIVQKLGLKLESAKGPSRVLIIDHVERPSEN